MAGGNRMTEQQIRELGPTFARFLGGFRPFFAQDRTADHFDAYCRGLLSDLPRKSVEPIALAAGTAVRTLQEFLKTFAWDHDGVRDALQRRLAAALPGFAGGGLGTVGVIDETSAPKKGDKTPGVQRQYLGCAGKVDNGIVTVHLAVTRGRFKALLDGVLYLPESWDADRRRCRAAGIPEGVRHQPKWRLALEQLARAAGNGLTFDWLVFDEGYGAAKRFLRLLDLADQRYVAEVPKSFRCRARPGAKASRAEDLIAHSPQARRQKWRPFRLKRQTGADQVWRAKAIPVYLGRERRPAHRLVVAESEATGEVKYFVTNAPAAAGLAVLLAVAFTRWNVEHVLRVAKSEVGLTHYEGRNYVGLERHLVLCAVALGFVTLHTERLRGEKPGADAGAGVPGSERAVRDAAGAAARDGPAAAHGGGHPVPPVAEQGRP
jgi:SRSO17 transposase